MSCPIPQPPTLPLLGNLRDVNPNQPVSQLNNLARKYGEIFKLTLFGVDRYFISSVSLINEVCDEKRFMKNIGGGLTELRNGVGAGLFTAATGEHDWGVAHRALTPAFGPLPIKEMYDEMYDIGTQLVAKWARKGPNYAICASTDFQRFTFDSIALCACGKRFNSFYTEEMHPFIDSMNNYLTESGRRANRTKVQTLLNREADRKYWADIAYMRQLSQEMVDERRANPTEKQDLLNALIYRKDPKTGENLSEESIINNMITFLVAGHETTASLLSFSFYYMLKNPETLLKAQQEVDEVVGNSSVKFEHTTKLPYIEAVFREALRLQPPAGALAMRARPEFTDPVIIGGKYTIPAGSNIVCLLKTEGQDPLVFGEDAAQFKPERMYKDKFANLTNNAWKPFGNGARGCIGRPFAWQEAIMGVAMILQNFNMRMDDPSYELSIKETLTIKPGDFRMRATLRAGIDPIQLERRLYAGGVEQPKHTVVPIYAKAADAGKPMSILYGGNCGTCEGLSQSLAAAAAAHGFKATVNDLDSSVDKFPCDQPVVVIASSYEGNPPDNAAAFVQWLKTADSAKFKGAQFAVFGCGHQDWVATYQKIPRLIGSELENKGAKRIVEQGETNVAAGTVFDDFDQWADKLWSSLSADEIKETSDGLDVEISTGTRASHLRHSVQDALVLKNELLTNQGVPQKRHIDIKLPTGMTYQAGDYMALLPINNIPTIARVLRHFHLPWDAMMKLSKASHTTIPTDKDISITAVLGAYVELQGIATRKNLATLVKYGADEAKLAGMTSKSVLEILEKCPEIELPFGVYLAMLPAMRIRQYSISSSPLNDPTVASLTFSVLESAEHLGVATNYLRDLKPGATVQIAIKKSHAAFHLPNDDSIPVIMAGAGTGLAPFHGFVQERAVKIAAGKKLGEAALFIGCRDPKEDKIYADELAQWEKEGAVKVYYAFSRAPEDSAGCKYTQDRMWHERAELTKLFDAGARAYICGSSKLRKGIADVVAKIAMETTKAKGGEKTYDECLKWWDSLRNERYAVDVFD